AALVASALFELSQYVKGQKGQVYFETAKQIVHELGGPKYRAKEGENANYVLMHSTGAIPQNSEIDVPLVYADYYFVEALHRYNKLLNNQPLF
ncbi:MAG: glycoside hydrolase family 88 protein, partial [Tannerellaceae bacterium]